MLKGSKTLGQFYEDVQQTLITFKTMPDAFDPYDEWLGIPAEDQPPHHYQLLGIDLFENDGEKIASAALSRTETLRTYQLGSHFEASQKILNQVAKAKLCLLDAEKKAAYDAQLEQRLSPAEPPGPTATDPAKIPHPRRPVRPVVRAPGWHRH